MKKMIMPIYGNVILRPYEGNPYVQKSTKEGFLLNDEQFDIPDSGERDRVEQLIRCAQVFEVGPLCKYVKPGDDVFYNIVTTKPVPFQREGFLLCNEQAIMAIMNDDLDTRFNNDSNE